MSFPKGKSINDGNKNDEYLDEKINLTYPNVDNLVSIVKKKGHGCLLFKRDLRRFYKFQCAQKIIVNWDAALMEKCTSTRSQ